jgi:hypothetical protein
VYRLPKSEYRLEIKLDAELLCTYIIAFWDLLGWWNWVQQRLFVVLFVIIFIIVVFIIIII